MKTRLIAISSSSFTAIYASVYTNRIVIGEDASVSGWPTTDLALAKPTAADQPRRLVGGTTYEFIKVAGQYFGPGDLLGYVKAITADTTIFIDEMAV